MSVDTGEVRVLGGPGELCARALGSCVALTAYDPVSGTGAMAHVMLPGSAPARAGAHRTRYVDDAVEALWLQLEQKGVDRSRLQVCLVGGANVLGEARDSPGLEIAACLTERLREQGLVPVATDIGGTERRSCRLNTADGSVSCTVGDSERRVLWEGNPRALQEESE